LIEDQTTNLSRRSIDFTNWQLTNLLVAADDTVSPSGQQDADKLTATTRPTSTENSNVKRPDNQRITVTADSVYTFSVYAKADTHDVIVMRLANFSGGLGPIENFYAIFDLTNGLARTFAADGTDQARIVEYPNGWYRCEVVITTGATIDEIDPRVHFGNSYATVLAYDAITYDATGQSIFLWGSQIETGSLSTSFVYTDTTEVLRETDTVYVDLTQTGIDYNNDKSSIIIEYSGRFDNTGTGFPSAWYISNVDDNDQKILLRAYEVGSSIAMSITTNGTSYITPGESITYPNFGGKHAARFRTDDIQVARDGVIDLQLTGTVVIENPTTERNRLYIGGQRGIAHRLNGHVKSIKYYNKPLPNKRLIALST
jgi:hypothetical protein